MFKEIALTIGAIAGVICLVAAIAAVAFDLRPLVFRSGSMSPAIQTGALGLARTTPATELQTGDVVSVINAAGVRITHRIESIDLQGDVATLTLRGDANQVADIEPYVVTSADRLFFHVNGVGYVVAWLSGRGGIFLGGLLAGALLMYAFGPRSRTQAEAEPRRGKSPRTKVVAAAALIAVLIAAVPLGRSGMDTEAAFTDSGTAKSGAFTALVLAPPVITCSILGGAIKLNWTANPAYAYRVIVTPGAGPANPPIDLPTGTATYTTGSGLLGGGSAVVQARYPGSNWFSVNSNTANWATVVITLCTA